jgi:acetylornithine deacetylase/succinyl-diaminopimelate desuccinylase-like protein
MALDKEAAKRILAEIDRDELAQLGCDLTGIPSPTGKEKAIAEFILAWFAANGLKAVRQDVEVDRPNAVGILKGDGSGLSLTFNGHTDTSFTGTGEDLRMVGNIEPEADLKGRIVGNKVQGLGISNMKGGVAAFMIAGKALKKSGIKLKGDVILAAVVGEISRTPIGLWQTQDYRGEGAGTRHLLTHGMHSDYAVCADGSDMNIVWTQTGVVQVKITTFGKAEAAWGTSRSAYPMEKVNAIVKMTKIIDAVERWGRSSKRNISTSRQLGRYSPRSTSARSKVERLTGRITSREFARSTSTCACLRKCDRSQSSLNWSGLSTNSGLSTRWTSINRCLVTREKMSSHWSSRPKKFPNICSPRASSRKRPTAPASGPIRTFTTSWGYQPSRSARAGGASAQETKRLRSMRW